MSDNIREGLGGVLAEIPAALPPSLLSITSEIKIMVSRATRHTHTKKRTHCLIWFPETVGALSGQKHSPNMTRKEICNLFNHSF